MLRGQNRRFPTFASPSNITANGPTTPDKEGDMGDTAASAPIIRKMVQSDLDQIVAIDIKVLGKPRPDYWELKLSPWDVAAGSLMVKEAGGMVTEFEGKTFTLSSPKILASNGRIHGEMLEVLRGM